MEENDLNINATLQKDKAFFEAEFIIIAVPTDYDISSSSFNTSHVDDVIADAINYNDNALIVIKSTIPIDYSSSMQKKYKTNRIIFSPEFLREGSALTDNLYPSRIIIGSKIEQAKEFAKLLQQAAIKENIDVLYTGPNEAESIKLFANTFLAMRVAFFNELDTFSIANKLNTHEIIEGVSLDSRIGDYYNNPSFGYGGYCLPKDTNQLLSSFNNIPQSMISAVVLSNKIRKDFILNMILELNPKVIGIFGLIMKSGSKNFRSAAIIDILKNLKDKGIKLQIFEPLLDSETFLDIPLIKDITSFKASSDLIVSNRSSDLLNDVNDKIFTRDIFGDN